MSYTVFLGNLPSWVTADDIRSWLTAENLVADQIKVIRNPETQESKGFAFIEAPNQEEMQSIMRRFDRAPLEDRLLRSDAAQPPKTKRPTAPSGAAVACPAAGQDRGLRRPPTRRPPDGPPTASGATTGSPSSGGSSTQDAGATGGAQPSQNRPVRERSTPITVKLCGPQILFAQ